ncbi:MAG TPA: hypothetical protein VFV38_40345 [Ktedonobacteraceae bacterium]|nr:hypothetical protein [Ktedonobacteraceae bacterium]
MRTANHCLMACVRRALPGAGHSFPTAFWHQLSLLSICLIVRLIPEKGQMFMVQFGLSTFCLIDRAVLPQRGFATFPSHKVEFAIQKARFAPSILA